MHGLGVWRGSTFLKPLDKSKNRVSPRSAFTQFLPIRALRNFTEKHQSLCRWHRSRPLSLPVRVQPVAEAQVSERKWPRNFETLGIRSHFDYDVLSSVTSCPEATGVIEIPRVGPCYRLHVGASVASVFFLNNFRYLDRSSIAHKLP